MSVSRDEVLHVARLARLRLSEAEVTRFTDQMNDILSHVEALAQVESTSAPAVDIALGPAPLRADEPGADVLDRPPEALAPGWTDGFFTLPRLPALDADAADVQPSDVTP